MCGKRFPNICIELDLFGCFRIEEIRDNGNKTGLKEGGGIEMSYKCQLQVLSIYAMHALSSLLNILTCYYHQKITVQFY